MTSARLILYLSLVSMMLAVPFSIPATGALSARGTGKRGLGWADNADPQDISLFDGAASISWDYNWATSPDPGITNDGLEYVPMQWNGVDADLLQQRAIALGATEVLGFNEPDNSGQANMSPQDAASIWQQYFDPISSNGIRLGAPAVTNGPDGIVWLQDFFSACSGCTVDFVPIHWYADSPASDLFSYAQNFYDTFGKPIWVTEFASTDSDQDTQSTFMSDALSLLDEADFVERYAWFGMFRTSSTSGPYAMIDSNGSLNALGQIYTTQ